MSIAPIIVMAIFGGIATIILVAGLLRLANRVVDRRYATPPADQSVLERLEQIERRLTDTQDVMIALSEKMDTLDSERSARAPLS